MTKSELVGYVKRSLGYPTVNIELTEDQINDSINNAINEIKPWYTVFKYLTIDVNTSCIDLTDYQVLDVTDVIKVLDVKDATAAVDDPYNINQLSVFGMYPQMYSTYKASYSSMTNQNIHTVISNYAKMYQEQFYNKLSYMVAQRTAGMLYENISWKFYDNKLYVDTCYPGTSIITIEYITNVKDVSDIEENSRYIRYLQDLSVSFSLMTQARVVGKYSTNGSPTTINYQDMRSDAQKDIDRIREDIRKTSNMFYITD